MKRPLRLFVWPEFQRDYSSGIAFALAGNEAEARDLIRAHENCWEEPKGPPEVFDQPTGWAVSGGS